MRLDKLLPLLQSIHGCTFASITARTTQKGVDIETTNEIVMLFAMKEGSGYENKVNKELERLGYPPKSFRAGPLPWGERVGNLPLITHNSAFYLQTILLKPGEKRYSIGGVYCPRPSWLRDRYAAGQGLPPDKQVIVNTYNIENIIQLKLKGETL